MIEDNKAKCPVTFFKNNMISDNLDLNYMMVAPYHSNLAASVTRSLAFDECKEEIVKTNNANKYYICQLPNLNAIYSYLEMNVSDLFTNLCLKSKSKFFDGFDYNKSAITFDDIKGAIKDFHISIESDLPRDVNVLYPIVDSRIEIIFQRLVVLINKEIQFTITDILSPKTVDEEDMAKYFYETKYRECFEIGKEFDLGNNSYENMRPEDIYTFLSSIYREVVSENLYDFRAALSKVGINVINMIIDSPTCFNYNHINDLNYHTEDMIKEVESLQFLGQVPTNQIEENLNARGTTISREE